MNDRAERARAPYDHSTRTAVRRIMVRLMFEPVKLQMYCAVDAEQLAQGLVLDILVPNSQRPLVGNIESLVWLAFDPPQTGADVYLSCDGKSLWGLHPPSDAVPIELFTPVAQPFYPGIPVKSGDVLRLEVRAGGARQYTGVQASVDRCGGTVLEESDGTEH